MSIILVVITIVLILMSGFLYHTYVFGKKSHFVQISQFITTSAGMFFGTGIFLENFATFWIYRLLLSIGAGFGSVYGMKKSRAIVTAK